MLARQSVCQDSGTDSDVPNGQDLAGQMSTRMAFKGPAFVGTQDGSLPDDSGDRGRGFFDFLPNSVLTAMHAVMLGNAEQD